jgi:signal transduction histidine kinase
MKRRTKASLSDFFQSKVKIWTASSFTVALLLSFLVLHWISKRESEKRAYEIAQTTSEAFRGTIFSGDILGAEIQAKKAFHMYQDEDIVILNPDTTPMLSGKPWKKEDVCFNLNDPCTKVFSKNISVVVPVYFDNTKSNLFGYIFVVVRERVNWPYMLSLTLGLLASLVVLSLGLIASMTSAFKTVSEQLLNWSVELKKHPKNLNVGETAPFSELDSVHEALQSLKGEIAKLEREARTEGKLMVLRGIAHDVMTPVSQLKKMLGVVKIQVKMDGNPSEEALTKFEQYLKKIERIASQVLVLKDNQIEKSSSGSLLKISDSIEIMAKDLQEEELFIERALRITTSGHSARLTKVSKIDLERIFSNLVRNAAHASVDGQSINIFISDQENFTEVCIQDFGSGISPEYHDQIFEVDFSTRPSAGTGLGLPIVKTICEKNGIHVSFSSELGSGTNFKLKIPTIIGGSSEIQNSAC